MRPRRGVIAVGVAGVLVAGACSAIRPDFSNVPVPTAQPPSADAPGPVLVTSEWGVVDGMLSVVVYNPGDRTLEHAEGVISARTADDRLVVSSLEQPTVCCRITNLAPHQELGFYVDAGPDAADISRVDVAYRDVTWEGVPSDGSGEAVPARPVELRHDDRGTVAVVRLTADRPLADALVQAFLTDATGDLVAVVSGRWNCLPIGSHDLRMQLFHPVPRGTEVDRVVAYRAPSAEACAA